jgi:hypothetical protein
VDIAPSEVPGRESVPSTGLPHPAPDVTDQVDAPNMSESWGQEIDNYDFLPSMTEFDLGWIFEDLHSPEGLLPDPDRGQHRKSTLDADIQKLFSPHETNVNSFHDARENVLTETEGSDPLLLLAKDQSNSSERLKVCSFEEAEKQSQSYRLPELPRAEHMIRVPLHFTSSSVPQLTRERLLDAIKNPTRGPAWSALALDNFPDNRSLECFIDLYFVHFHPVGSKIFQPFLFTAVNMLLFSFTR